MEHPPSMRVRVVSSPFCDVIERRACETFKNYRQHYVISRHVGGLLGDVSWHVSVSGIPWEVSMTGGCLPIYSTEQIVTDLSNTLRRISLPICPFFTPRQSGMAWIRQNVCTIFVIVSSGASFLFSRTSNSEGNLTDYIDQFSF